jgi:hypothetical protein
VEAFLDLDNLDADMLRRALALYLRAAFPDGLPEDRRPMIRLPVQGSLPEVLRGSSFEPVSLADDGSRIDIWRLPIGTRDSDRVKFCLKRVSLSDEFLFNVDIHDLYLSRPDGEESEDERREREASEVLKRKVESEWAAAGLPTFVKYMEDYLDRSEGG